MEISRKLTRANKGLQLERQTRNQWRPARIGIHIPSQTQPGTVYNTSLDGCSCMDHQCRLIVCKHMMAVRIFMGRKAA